MSHLSPGSLRHPDTRKKTNINHFILTKMEMTEWCLQSCERVEQPECGLHEPQVWGGSAHSRKLVGPVECLQKHIRCTLTFVRPTDTHYKCMHKCYTHDIDKIKQKTYCFRKSSKLLTKKNYMPTTPVQKNLFMTFQKCKAYLCYILIDKQMLEKVFCSKIAPSFRQGTSSQYQYCYLDLVI